MNQSKALNHTNIVNVEGKRQLVRGMFHMNAQQMRLFDMLKTGCVDVFMRKTTCPKIMILTLIHGNVKSQMN